MEVENKEGEEQKVRIQHNLCEKRVLTILEKDEKVKQVIDAIRDAGCELPSPFIQCIQCTNDQSGGFVPNMKSVIGDEPYRPQISVCENHTIFREEVEHTVLHELFHAYDQCTGNIRWENCHHHACSEIRASANSGECDLLFELWRGNPGLKAQKAKCVKRRAGLSLSNNPYCDKDRIPDYIDNVFEQCYNDPSPLPCDISTLKREVLKGETS